MKVIIDFKTLQINCYHRGEKLNGEYCCSKNVTNKFSKCCFKQCKLDIVKVKTKEKSNNINEILNKWWNDYER